MRSTFQQDEEEYAFISEIKSETLKRWVEHIDTIVDEFVLQIDADGFRSVAVDNAQVGMVDTTLHKEAFERHRAGTGGTGTITVGIILEKFLDVVGLMNKGDTVSVAFDQETGKIHLKGSGIKRSIALISPDSIQQIDGLPTVDLPTVVTLSATEFKTGLESCEAVSENFTIGYNDNDEGDRMRGVFFYAEGDNDDNLYEPPEQQVHEHGPARTILSSTYVEMIEKTVRLKNPTKEVVIEVGQDVPAKFHISVDEEIGDESVGTIDTTFCLAPRLDQHA